MSPLSPQADSPQAETRAQLRLVSAPSGVGKSTWLVERYPQASLVSMDEIRGELTGDVNDQSRNQEVFELAFERLKGLLERGAEVAWDATSLRLAHRQSLYELAAKYKAFVSVDVLFAPLELALERNQQRDRQVPKHVIEAQYKGWEPPLPSEADEVRYWRAHEQEGWSPSEPPEPES